MNLCQKCEKDVSDLCPGFAITVVPESNCEFWAHKKLREAIAFIDDREPGAG